MISLWSYIYCFTIIFSLKNLICINFLSGNFLNKFQIWHLIDEKMNQVLYELINPSWPKHVLSPVPPDFKPESPQSLKEPKQIVTFILFLFWVKYKWLQMIINFCERVYLFRIISGVCAKLISTLYQKHPISMSHLLSKEDRDCPFNGDIWW